MPLKSAVVCSMLLVLAACATQASREPADTAALFKEEIGRFVAADRSAPPEPCQVLFVGSSSFVYWKTLASDLAPLPVINRGFGGSQISDVNYWFDQVVAPYRPSVIVFYAGENDVDAGKSVEQIAADFDAFMTRKTQALGAVPVYFISLKPSRLRFDQLQRQTEVNERIRRQTGVRADLHFIDVVPHMLEDGQPKDLFMPDDLHMRAEGYRLWTQVVREALLPRAEAQEQQCRQSLGS